MLAKILLRKKFKLLRQNISVEYRKEAAQKAAKIFIEHPLVQQSTTIACYMPYQDEFDCIPIIEAIWQAKKECFLPVLVTGQMQQIGLLKKEGKLSFIRYDVGDRLSPNDYGILEPVRIKQKLEPNELDMVIVPLIAFDEKGDRLGTGGGFYDRTFAFLKTKQDKQKPLFIGLGYAAQQVKSIPIDKWDVQLNGVITEKDFISCAKQATHT